MSAGALTLVVLAAGAGTRFGGVKQLAPVGPNGEAILDFLLARAQHAGVERAVIVTAPSIEGQVRAHLDAHAPALPVNVALQVEPTGTADALLAARPFLSGAFAAVNADDLYPSTAFESLVAHLSSSRHLALVAFHVAKTLIGDQPVKRATVEFDAERRLTAITESVVKASTLGGRDWVSMNMWGFQPRFLDALDDVRVDPTSGEVLLPDVVSALIDAGEVVRVLLCEEPCIGITYAEDADVVRASLA
jgi:dTDP-glucose pyrophosphorylase